MARKQQKKSVRKPVRERQPKDRRWVYPAALTLITLGSLGGLGVGARVGTDRLERMVADRYADRTTRVLFEWPRYNGVSDGPGDTWLPPTERNALLSVVYDIVDRNPDPLRAETLEQVGRALMATGWFQEIGSVRREDDGVLRITAPFRTPVAAVRHAGADRLVAAHGELLPLSYPPDASGRRVISGVALGPPTDTNGRARFGEPWPGGDVQQAIELMSLLSGKAWWTQVAGVDVSDLLGSGRMVIITDTGSRVLWGAPPGRFAPGEKNDTIKLQRLDEIFRRWGRIDAGQRFIEIQGEYVLKDETIGGPG